MITDISKVRFGLMGFMVLLAVISFVGCASARTIYVPTDYATIQEAIDNATEGDTVFVYNGTYYESVSIAKDRITLQGEDANVTTIHGNGTADKVVYVTGNYVNVSGFTVTGSTAGGDGIYVTEGDYCNISDNDVVDGRYGIYLLNSDNSTVARNNASERYYGIILYNSRNCSVTNNTANYNYYYGIYLYVSSGCMLTNNTANYNEWGSGIWLHFYSSECVLTNNTANYNHYYGIHLSSYSSGCVFNNTANYNDDYGIYLSYSSGCVLTNNTANYNDDYGICLSSSSSCNITRNTVNSNENGIWLYRADNNNVTENTIANNTGYGIYLDYSDDCEIYHNNFVNNANQAYDHGGFNSWDKGATVGGNYWSDHTCHGNPSDGTEPYTGIDTDAGAVDNYPFGDADGWVKVEEAFDTGSGTYPSIMGIHNGTIKPSHDVIVNKMYTYPCPGTGGHSEGVAFYNSTTGKEIANGTWKGYAVSDYHYIEFDNEFVLHEGFTYNYTIKTGSYPQIIHEHVFNTTRDGEITCTEFIDANGKRYDDWIPAIILE